MCIKDEDIFYLPVCAFPRWGHTTFHNTESKRNHTINISSRTTWSAKAHEENITIYTKEEGIDHAIKREHPLSLIIVPSPPSPPIDARDMSSQPPSIYMSTPAMTNKTQTGGLSAQAAGCHSDWIHATWLESFSWFLSVTTRQRLEWVPN